MANRIHIFGASGSGTSTLGQAVAATLEIPFLDTDTFYWKVTDPPFTDKYTPAERLAMIADTVRNTRSWVLSGSLCNWGDPLLEDFTLAVFLYLDPGLRMQRLAEREKRRYGSRINPGGDMWQIHRGFMAWADSYDTARAPTRSLHLHNQWRTRLACPQLELDSSRPLQELVAAVVADTVSFDHGGGYDHKSTKTQSGIPAMKVRQAEVKDKKDWLEMRELLWPDHGDEHQHAIDAYFSGRPLFMDQVFVCEDNHGGLAGFIELQLRNYAEGSKQTPVPYIEGWFVHERHRREQVGRRLLEQAEQWALLQGFSQLGSNVEIENQNSINAHLALGFTEVERSVSFLKTLSQDQLTGKTILHTERQQHE